MKKILPGVIIAAVLIVAIGGGAWLMWSPARQTPPPPAPAKSAPGAPRAQADDAPPAHTRGRSDAPVVLEEFADFQCPTCAAMHPIVKQLLAKYPTQVRVEFRHFPLREMHRNAAEASRAAEAAGMQGKFWEMHDLLYERQKEWSESASARPLFVQYAQSLGLDTARFLNDIDSSVVSMRVIADERRGQALGITGTPSFFVNGRQLPFEQSNTLDKLSAAVERELAARGR